MSCRHVNTGGYRCSRPSLAAHRGYCRQHAPPPHLPPPVPPPSQPSRRGGRGGASRLAVPAPAATPAPPQVPPDAGACRRGPSAGRTPTVEQLLGRIDRLRASSPSAESAWSEDSDREAPVLGSARQYTASGCNGDSSEAESGAEGAEAADVLQRAGAYTAEEAALVARDKLVRQQALYIQQFSRLQHLLREGRRRYLHELKLERQAEADASKERQLAAEAGEDNSERSSHSERGSATDGVPSRSGGRGAPQRNQHDAEEKLRAVWRYHRHRGVCAVLRRKAWDRRADTTAPPGPRCIHTEGGVRCSERCLPGSKFCLRHILHDPHQMLFVPCAGRRSLTLEQRDEEFSRSRRKARRTSAGSRAAASANTSRQPAPTSSRTSARACARGTNPAVAAVLAARGRASTVNRARPRAAAAAAPATSRKRAVVGVVAPIPRNRDAARAVAARAVAARAVAARAVAARAVAARAVTARAIAARAVTARAVARRGGTARGSAGAARSGPARAEAAHSSRGTADVAASSAGRTRRLKSVNLKALQKELNSKVAADITAAVRNEDAAAFAAALGVEKTPSIEKLVRRRTVARIVDAMERRDAAAVLAARMSARKPRTSSERVAKSKRARGDSAREVIVKARKIAALAAVLQSEEARRLVAALKSRDPAAVYAALKSKDAAAVEAALRAKDAAALAAALRPVVPPAAAGNRSGVASGSAAGVPAARRAGPSNVPAPPAPATSGARTNAPTASRFKDAVALMASLKPEDKSAVMAALRAKDTDALKAVLKSESVAPVIADLKAKGLIVPAKATKSNAAAVTEGPPAKATAARPGPVASVAAPVTRKSGDVAASSSVGVRPEDARATAPVKSVTLVTTSKSENVAISKATPKSENVAGSKATPKSENAAISNATPKSENVAASKATPKSENVAISKATPKSENVAISKSTPKSENVAVSKATPKSEKAGTSTATPKTAPSAPPASRAPAISPKAIAARGPALGGKVSAAVRGKSAAAKAAAAKLKAAATTLAARKAKKRVHCQEPVLRVFEADMRCPWHAVYVRAAEGEAGGPAVPKVEVKAPKEEAGEDGGPDSFSPLNKKIKMELDEMTPDIGCIVGEVEMKTEPNDEAADDIASVSGSGNQADLSTESTLSATSPRGVDDDMDDDCRDLDLDVDPGAGAEEVMLQPPLGADDADLVAVAQGVAVVGAQEEVAVAQQDDDSLTNPPVAVDEVEVS